MQLRFLDRSVPPEAHRSYTIVIENGSLYASVDVYGDPIAAQSRTVTAAQWTDLVALATSLPPASPVDVGADAAANGDAVGGASYSLQLWAGGERSSERVWSASHDDAAAAELAAQVEALVPNLREMIATEYVD